MSTVAVQCSSRRGPACSLNNKKSVASRESGAAAARLGITIPCLFPNDVPSKLSTRLAHQPPPPIPTNFSRPSKAQPYIGLCHKMLYIKYDHLEKPNRPPLASQHNPPPAKPLYGLYTYCSSPSLHPRLPFSLSSFHHSPTSHLFRPVKAATLHAPLPSPSLHSPLPFISHRGYAPGPLARHQPSRSDCMQPTLF